MFVASSSCRFALWLAITLGESIPSHSSTLCWKQRLKLGTIGQSDTTSMAQLNKLNKPAATPATPATKAKDAASKAKKAIKVAPPSVPSKGQWYVTIGTKGCALWKGMANTKGEVAPLENTSGRPASFPPVTKTGSELLVAWKGNSEQSQAGKAVRAWVSQAGQKVAIYPLSEALKKGHIVKLQAAVDRGNGERRETVYAPKGTNKGHKAPQYVGAEVPGGRYETTMLSKLAAGRADNVQFAASVVFI